MIRVLYVTEDPEGASIMTVTNYIGVVRGACALATALGACALAAAFAPAAYAAPPGMRTANSEQHSRPNSCEGFAITTPRAGASVNNLGALDVTLVKGGSEVSEVDDITLSGNQGYQVVPWTGQYSFGSNRTITLQLDLAVKGSLPGTFILSARGTTPKGSGCSVDSGKFTITSISIIGPFTP
jgi:hypothetical protein